MLVIKRLQGVRRWEGNKYDGRNFVRTLTLSGIAHIPAKQQLTILFLIKCSLASSHILSKRTVNEGSPQKWPQHLIKETIVMDEGRTLLRSRESTLSPLGM